MSKNISVSKLVDYLKKKNEQDSNLLNITITGELSNVKIYPSNHMYFDLKDDKSKINGVMFASNVKSLNFKPSSGDKVNVIGNVKVYQNNATFQIIANKIEKDGFGQLYIEFEKNKKILEEAGYFKQEHKKDIPLFPSRIAVIAGHNSAALKDILVTLNNRYKLSQVIAFPTTVQGEKAPAAIIEMIKLVDKLKFDVILLARGGGSFEDLNAFNNVDLAMTIFNANTPIVSGIGHEVDFTIADFVSDYRATTPTAAAIKVSPDVNELNSVLVQLQMKIKTLFNHKIDINKQKLDNISSSVYFKDYSYLLSDKFQSIDYYLVLLNNQINNRLNAKKEQLNSLKLSLEQNNIKYKIQTQYLFLKENSIKIKQNFNKILDNKKNIVRNQNNLLENNYQAYILEHKNIVNENIIKLNLLDPNNILEKGYNILYFNNSVVKDFKKLKPNDHITIKGGHHQVLEAIINEVNINGK